MGLEWGGMCSGDAARAKGHHPNNSSTTMSALTQKKHWRREDASRKREVAVSGSEEAEGHLGPAGQDTVASVTHQQTRWPPCSGERSACC